jgi:hypothetical protein
MGIVAPDNLTDEQQMIFLKENILNKKENDMPNMIFECVENPYSIAKIAQQSHEELLIIANKNK